MAERVSPSPLLTFIKVGRRFFERWDSLPKVLDDFPEGFKFTCRLRDSQRFADFSEESGFLLRIVPAVETASRA